MKEPKKIVISFSGGKDSVASYIRAVEKYPDTPMYLLFTDTGDEAPETYEYLRWFNEHIHPVLRLAQRLVKDNGRRTTELVQIPWSVAVEDLDTITIFDEIRRRHLVRPDAPPWPGRGLRYCTRALKINVFYRWIRQNISKGEREWLLIIKGMRSQESRDREGREVYYVELEGGDFYNTWLAVYKMTLEEVFALSALYRIPFNPVYNIRSRSNCEGCPLSSLLDIRRTAKIRPTALDEYISIEDETGYTWRDGISIRDVVESAVETDVAEVQEEESCLSGFCDI